MTHSEIIQQLAFNKAAFQSLLSNLSNEQILWKPNSTKWCILEIICHLHDEEIEDFRTRTKFALESSTGLPPAIDPVGWVSARNYINQDFLKKLDAFLHERDNSIKWLKGLVEPNWKNGFEHPKMGFLTGDFYLNNWLAHDYLHIRQITRTKYQYLQHHAKISIDYAGNW